ncbi:MAG: neutral/alkaline non-lysosomal ceramidase N-terminal domain-containing protein [Symbiobacteriia bacterium]
MRLGTSVVTITPQVPVPMGGYGARTGQAAGVHDPLTARALVLEDEGVRTGFVVADLLMLNHEQAEAARQGAASLTGIDPDHLVVATTHTHSGPSTLANPLLGGAFDAAYMAWVIPALAGAIYQAARELEEVLPGWAAGEVAGVGSGRRTAPADPDPQPLTVLSFFRPDGSLRAALVNFQCHPTLMGADNLLISADLAGAGRDAAQALLGPDVFVALANGACGDVSTRFTRRSQTFQEMRRLGAMLGAAAAGLALRAEPQRLAKGALRVGAVTVDLPMRQLPPVEVAQAQLEQMQQAWEKAQANPTISPGDLRLARTAMEGAQVQAFLAATQGQGERRAELAGWRLGNAGLVTIPGEMFASLGERIRAGSGLAATLVVGYSGGHVGYIPDREGFQSGGYEALSSPLLPEAGDLLAEAAAGLLRRLGSD